MLIITLGSRSVVNETGDEFLPRTHVGWDASLSDEEVYEAGRGWWRMASDAEGERLALVIGGSVVRVAVEIQRWAVRSDGRRAFAGRILGPGDPVRDRFVGKPDPSGSTSRNPARYWKAPGVVGQYKPCLCGCGREVRNRWLPGHDQSAIHELIGREFGGDVAEFVAAHPRNPELEAYVFQLHREVRPWGMRADEVDWDATAVGAPVTFWAIRQGSSGWLAPGAVVAVAPEALETAGWSVRVAGRRGHVPTITGDVGRPLALGEQFPLPVTNVWVGGVPRSSDVTCTNCGQPLELGQEGGLIAIHRGACDGGPACRAVPACSHECDAALATGHACTVVTGATFGQHT